MVSLSRRVDGTEGGACHLDAPLVVNSDLWQGRGRWTLDVMKQRMAIYTITKIDKMTKDKRDIHHSFLNPPDGP